VDIWSFGCIIYELFTGKTPFYANTYPKLAPLILYQQVQYPKEMPAELKELLSWMLQKNPNARPGWKELKSHSFFQQVEPLKEKIENGLIREGLK
jgi:serine/threonine protein kinase